MENKVKKYIDEIRKDYQLDPMNPEYCGFINIDPSDSGEDTEVALELVKNWQKYESYLEEQDLYFESTPWEEEMVIAEICIKTDGNNACGTSLQGYLRGYTYSQLVEAFGKPTYEEASGDDKVQFEWEFSYKGEPFTLYDWKTYDRNYSMTELTTWNIGGKSYYGDFHTWLENKLN